ncbi:hypothetical protein BpHYR1_015034 [Brachionus plicatilis]|uniref:Uncharacterized protein n=1 Tax=Brachionus plicatilis TaxID=10195 RepID=A0A3M7QJQ8_BRAPC|nr:hypothetical protein BpHYR1_015034 [Brachionus plicatilis]
MAVVYPAELREFRKGLNIIKKKIHKKRTIVGLMFLLVYHLLIINSKLIKHLFSFYNLNVFFSPSH